MSEVEVKRKGRRGLKPPMKVPVAVKAIEGLLSKRSGCYAIIGSRGSAKSFTNTLFLEEAIKRGYKIIDIDIKNELELIHHEAVGWQRKLREKHGLPVHRWGLAQEGGKVWHIAPLHPEISDVPVFFDLQPISLKMLADHHFDLLSGILTATAYKQFQDAFLSAGGRSRATMEQLTKQLLQEYGTRVDKGLLWLLSSGFFADESDLEPERFLERLAEGVDWVVLHISVLPTGSMNLAYWWLYVFLENLMDYLKANSGNWRFIVVVREAAKLCPREEAEGVVWYLRKLFNEIVRVMRRVKGGQMKLAVEAQEVRIVPKGILSNLDAALLAPTALDDEEQIGAITRRFKHVTRDLIRRFARLKPEPGMFLYVDRRLKIAKPIRFPVPGSLMLSENPRGEERRVRESVDRMSLAAFYDRATNRYKAMKLRAKVEAKLAKKAQKLELPEFDPASPVEVIDVSSLSATFSRIIVGVRIAIESAGIKTGKAHIPLYHRWRAKSPHSSVRAALKFYITEQLGIDDHRTIARALNYVSRHPFERARMPARLTMMAFGIDPAVTERNVVLTVDIKRFNAAWKTHGKAVYGRSRLPGTFEDLMNYLTYLRGRRASIADDTQHTAEGQLRGSDVDQKVEAEVVAR